MQNKKIIFFDSWKGGRGNYKRLLPALSEKGFEAMLIHLGSWGNETVFEKEEHEDGLLMRDISYYGNKSFYSILKAEQPDVVLLLSTATFAHRAFLRYCAKLNIPTIHLFHGLVRVQDVDNGSIPYKVNFIAYAKFVLARLPKLIYKTFPVYIKALLSTKASPDEWRSFCLNAVHYISRPSVQKIAADAKTSLCLVYADADKVYAKNVYGFNDDEVISVGNPDLVHFGLQATDIALKLKPGIPDERQFVYIDTALRAAGVIFKNDADFIDHLLETNSVLQNSGYRLLFKPHPDTRNLINLSLLEKEGIRIIDNSSLLPELRKSSGVIAEPSSLTLVPAVMGLKIALVKYGRAADLKYGDVLTSYPRATLLYDLNMILSASGNDISDHQEEHVMCWIQNNIGPMPADQMPRRVVQNIQQLIA